MTTGKRPIAVIGSGFSGILAALHLRRRMPADQPLLLCQRPQPTDDGGEAQNLLNVRAANMAALGDEPDHFAEWLTRNAVTAGQGVHETEAGAFVTRDLYAAYLRSLLERAERTSGEGSLLVMGAQVVDITPNANGYVLACDGGIEVAGVLLAQDNLPPEEGPDPRICADPWGPKAARPLDNAAPVLIVGAGLAMVDVAVALRRRGFTGKIYALSRRGLLPARHTPVGEWDTPNFTLAEERSLTQMMMRVRDEVFAAEEQGVNWRAVIDSIRPITARLWVRLPQEERRRFLRHARRHWDTHRHRLAPPTADQIDAMRAQGSLQVLAGRIHGFDSGARQVTVHYTPRGSATPTTLSAQRVIIASFLDQIGRTRDPLMQRMLDRGMIRMDAYGLGLQVTDELNVVRDDGTVDDHMWALGPIVRGVFWECVAIPDVRLQATHAAVTVVARLREDERVSGFSDPPPRGPR